MIQKIQLRWVYGIALAFILLNTFLITKEHYWLPVLSVIVLIFYLGFYHLNILFFLSVLITPLSVNFKNEDLNVAMSLPSEPLMIVAMIAFIVKLSYDGIITRKLLMHPVTIAILIYLLWLFFSSITSRLPVVSFKFLAARCWFVVSCYFLGLLMFKKFENIKIFTWLYMIPFAGVIIYTLIRHGQTGFDEHHAHWAMWPFYYDHTIYGAAIAMFIPVLTGYLFTNRFYKELLSKFIIALFFILFGAGMILSYTRAGWLSLCAAFAVFIVMKMRIRFALLTLFAILAGIYLYLFREELQMKLEKNQNISSDEFTEHIQSMYNITTDVSNTERINRWKSAMRMFYERPVTGWGPGTYMFLYAPFQTAADMTWVSTNAGNLGNAHSEYIGPLAETGIMGGISFLLIVIFMTWRAVKFIFSSAKPEAKIMMLTLFLGLLTYFVHGILNNFLDTDKAAVPFWGFLAAVTALDVFHTHPPAPSPSHSSTA